MADKSSKAPIIIKKYANRRLYNTATSAYVTLEDLSRMVQQGVEFTVQDAKTKEDLTRAVLTQIIVEEEQKGQNLLPIGFLRQLIGLYGDSMGWMVPQYLESTMALFARNQEQMRKQMQSSMGGAFPFPPLEEMGKQNMAMFEQAMRMFNPFAPRGVNGSSQPDDERPARPRAETPADPPPGDALDEMRRQLAAMQRQLDALSRRKDD